MDLALPQAHQGRYRRDWGLKNVISANHASNRVNGISTGHAQRQVMLKIAGFCASSVFPQQLTVPRQYATTEEGVRIHKVMKGRIIDGVREDGVRVVVQENGKQARFVMSPLFGSEFDAITWAKRNMGLS